MDIFRELEDAAVSALSPLTDLGLKTLEAYSGQLSAGDLSALAYRFPAAYVYCGGARAAAANRNVYAEIALGILIGDRSLRRSGAREESGSPGIYALLQAAYHRLQLQPILGPDNGPLILSSVDPVAGDPTTGVFVYNMEFLIETVLEES